LTFGQNAKSPEINVVYGKKHIFTIETPDNWINDKDFAQKIGLVCFFYPKKEKNESKRNYFFANGIDKGSSKETIANFINGDLGQFRKKYPDMTFAKTPVEITGGLRNGILYSFSNLTDKYKEEILYGETDDSFLIFSFSALSSGDFELYQPVFDKFIASFKYRGNDPKPFLDYMNKKK
jgi:hypothetical protein